MRLPSVVVLFLRHVAFKRQITKPNFVKKKMTLIVLHPIMFANCRKLLSHKTWWAETQPLDRSDDGIQSGAASRDFLGSDSAKIQTKKL